MSVRTPATQSQVISNLDLWVFFLNWVRSAPADFAGSGLSALAGKIWQQSMAVASSIMGGDVLSGQLLQVRNASLLEVDERRMLLARF